MKASILRQEILRIISDFVVDSESAILAFARAGADVWTAADCLCWFVHVFANATSIFVLKLQPEFSK